MYLFYNFIYLWNSVLKGKAERIDLILGLMESASLEEYKCEEAYDFLVELGTEGYVDSEFLKDFPETVEIVRKVMIPWKNFLFF